MQAKMNAPVLKTSAVVLAMAAAFRAEVWPRPGREPINE